MSQQKRCLIIKEKRNSTVEKRGDTSSIEYQSEHCCNATKSKSRGCTEKNVWSLFKIASTDA